MLPAHKEAETMMKFLKAIMKGMRAALRAMRRLAGAPFAWLGGGDYEDEPDFDEADEVLPGVSEFEKRQEAAEAQAIDVIRYAAASVLYDVPAPLPPPLPPALREWCRGLSRDECLAICGARPEAVSSHIKVVFLLPDVRKVCALPTAQSEREPLADYDNGSPHFLSAACSI